MTTATETARIGAEALDPMRVEAFVEQLSGGYVQSAVTLMIDVGHKAGLFEAAVAGPATSEELADRAGLHERYVREWLGCMTTAGIMTFDPDDGRYTLPAEHAVVLTGDSPTNMAVIAPLISHLGTHVNGVVDAFRHGGGVPYSAYRPEFTEMMDDLNRRQYDALLVDTYLPLAGGLVSRLERGIAVADIGCGTGHCVNLMARAFPASTFVGYDIADDAIARARSEAAAWGLHNVAFEVADVRALPAGPRYGLITAFDAVHDQADPAAVLAGAHEALAETGTFFMVDVRASSNVEDNLANPMAPMIYAISTLHCLTVSLAEGGAGLGTAWGEQLATRMLRDAGFTGIEVHDLPGDPMNLLYIGHR